MKNYVCLGQVYFDGVIYLAGESVHLPEAVDVANLPVAVALQETAKAKAKAKEQAPAPESK